VSGDVRKNVGGDMSRYRHGMAQEKSGHPTCIYYSGGGATTLMFALNNLFVYQIDFGNAIYPGFFFKLI